MKLCKKKIRRKKSKIKRWFRKLYKRNEQLKANLAQYKIENERLKLELMKTNKIISGIQNNQIDNKELKI